MKQNILEGNMLLRAGILLSGLTFEPIKRLMSIAGVQFFGKSTFYKLQKQFLFLAINYVYNEQQNEILTTNQDKDVDLIGDGCF